MPRFGGLIGSRCGLTPLIGSRDLGDLFCFVYERYIVQIVNEVLFIVVSDWVLKEPVREKERVNCTYFGF